MGVPGIEPGTSSLSGTRSNQLSYTPPKQEMLVTAGGGNRVRTGGPELAKLVLYQLSYAPSIIRSTDVAPGAWTPAHGRPSRNNLPDSLSVRERCDLKPLSFTDTTRPCLRMIVWIDRIPFPLARKGILLRKEVIQPQVPLRLPCYDFIPITTHTLGTSPPCGLVQ